MKLHKLVDLLLNLAVVFEAHRIKGVTLLWAAEAAKQLVICVRHRKISALMLIANRYSLQHTNKTFARLLRSLSLWLPRASGSIYVHIGHARV